jgi:hypothetical protein
MPLKKFRPVIIWIFKIFLALKARSLELFNMDCIERVS